MKSKLKILQKVKAAAISRNDKARANKNKARNKENAEQIYYDHRYTDAKYADRQSTRAMNELARGAGHPEEAISGEAIDAEFNLDCGVIGWASGNNYENRERKRLGFSRSCVMYQDAG